MMALLFPTSCSGGDALRLGIWLPGCKPVLQSETEIGSADPMQGADRPPVGQCVLQGPCPDVTADVVGKGSL